MPLPSAILAKIHDCLRIPASVTTWDSLIHQHYETILKEFLLKSDVLVEVEAIPAAVGQSLYRISTRAVRLLSLFHNRSSLLLVPSRTNDLLTEWEVEEASTPETFTFDSLPVTVDDVTTTVPEQFLVRPKPSVAASGEAGFLAWEVAVPANLAAPLVLVCLVPYLSYATASRVLAQDIEIRDLPASQVWMQIAELWRSVILATIKV